MEPLELQFVVTVSTTRGDYTHTYNFSGTPDELLRAGIAMDNRILGSLSERRPVIELAFPDITYRIEHVVCVSSRFEGPQELRDEVATKHAGLLAARGRVNTEP